MELAVAILGLLATFGLVAYAAVQTRHIAVQSEATRDQAAAAAAQVELLRAEHREDAEQRADEAGRRLAEDRSRSEALAAQLEAVRGIADALQGSVRGQVQPIVFANNWRGYVVGVGAKIPRSPTGEQADLEEGEVLFRYYLSNEGLGLALDVEHGVRLMGTEFSFGRGMRFRSARPGEFLPPLDPGSRDPVPASYISLVVAPADLPDGWRAHPVVYWARFSNVFGDRFLTLNPDDPTQPAEFEPLDP